LSKKASPTTVQDLDLYLQRKLALLKKTGGFQDVWGNGTHCRWDGQRWVPISLNVSGEVETVRIGPVQEAVRYYTTKVINIITDAPASVRTWWKTSGKCKECRILFGDEAFERVRKNLETVARVEAQMKTTLKERLPELIISDGDREVPVEKVKEIFSVLSDLARVYIAVQEDSSEADPSK
jgi:hypothetical protein